MTFTCTGCKKTYRTVGKRPNRTLCIDCEEAALRALLKKPFQAG